MNTDNKSSSNIVKNFTILKFSMTYSSIQHTVFFQFLWLLVSYQKNTEKDRYSESDNSNYEKDENLINSHLLKLFWISGVEECIR